MIEDIWFPGAETLLEGYLFAEPNPEAKIAYIIVAVVAFGAFLIGQMISIPVHGIWVVGNGWAVPGELSFLSTMVMLEFHVFQIR